MNTIRRDNLEGCVSVVDFEYPKKLHDLHNDHPFAPEKIEKKSTLSNYCKEIKNNYNISDGGVKTLYLVYLTNIKMLFTIKTCNYIYS